MLPMNLNGKRKDNIISLSLLENVLEIKIFFGFSKRVVKFYFGLKIISFFRIPQCTYNAEICWKIKSRKA
jgi:hypothetical protein